MAARAGRGRASSAIGGSGSSTAGADRAAHAECRLVIRCGSSPMSSHVRAVFLALVAVSAAAWVLLADSQHERRTPPDLDSALSALPEASGRAGRAPVRPAPQPPAELSPPAAAAPRAPAGPALYRCDRAGRTTYQSEPCGAGATQTEIGGGTVSVVPAFSAAPTHAPPGRAVGGARGGTVGLIQAPKSDLIDHARCAQIRSEIERIDARARYRSTDRLRERRRELVEESDALHCETWPS